MSSHTSRKHLEVLVRDKDGHQVARCLVRRGRYMIGQDKRNEIVVDEPSVSSRHARLTIASESEIFIEDLESANGTLVNGAPAVGSTPVSFESHIVLGQSTLTFHRAGLPAAVFDLLPEHFLRDARYNFGELLVQGSTSSIYEAIDTSLGRRVAVKVMRPEVQASTQHVLRFIREAQISSQLQHPGILPIYELGLDEQSHLFYTTRFVEGESLATILDQVAAGQSAHSLASLLTIFQRACDAVAFAHSCGVIHCGLRPDAITVGQFGEVFVGNWGLAKIETRDETGAPIAPKLQVPTSNSLPAITPFTAPEQATASFDEITARSDIYSLGAILYRILSLHDPVADGSETELLELILTASVRPLSSFAKESLPHCPGGHIPDALAQVAMRALNHTAEQRHASVAALQQEITAVQDAALHPGSNLLKQFSGLLGKH